MESYKIPRHKVFISYHHDNDQFYANELMNEFVEFNPYKSFTIQSIFEDCSIHDGDIDDSLPPESIRKKIRDEFIKDASVLIVLCGSETRKRKYVDWEIHAAMFDTDNNPKLGILVITLPTISQWVFAPEDTDKPLVSRGNVCTWYSLASRQDMEKYYPYLPSRIVDNFEASITNNDIIPIAVVDWETIKNDVAKLKQLIDIAYNRSKDSTKHYNHSAPLRTNNS